MNTDAPANEFDWENGLDELDPLRRKESLTALEKNAPAISSRARETNRPGNLHSHTFFSYNSQGWSPARYALLARRHGMEVAGIVDFDVLDGMEEFHTAGRWLNLRTVVSMETRVFVPEFSDRVINSPGEPGVAYHMAAGWCRLPSSMENNMFLRSLGERAARRNRTMISRLNEYFDELAISYETDVLPLTPHRNATERHIVQAYARRAASIFTGEKLLAFWTDKTGPGLSPADLPESPRLFNQIRSKTMKIGGAGYTRPTSSTFPLLSDFNAYAIHCGAIPMIAWLDGTSAGESSMDEWASVAAKSGACAINIIPDRNFTPGVNDAKRQNLYDVVDLANRLDWPVIAGTEMNSYGQKFVDDFDSAELRPLVPVFQRGARILYAHTALQRAAGIGYIGAWADTHLADRKDRNTVFEAIGAALSPRTEERLQGLQQGEGPEDIMRRIRS